MFSIRLSQPPFWKGGSNFDLILNMNIGSSYADMLMQF